MGRYVTPAGVVIEMADKAALAVGYKAVQSEQPAPVAGGGPPTPKRRPGRPKASG